MDCNVCGLNCASEITKTKELLEGLGGGGACL